jgi:DNA primase
MSSLYEKLLEKLGGRQYNGYFSCCCPFHPDHSPSFFVYEDGGWFCKSNSCHARGKSLEELDRRLGGRSVKVSHSKPQVLPKWREWEQKWGDLAGIAKHAHETCINRPNEMWYLKDRKIDQFFELGCFGMIDFWCLFPVFDAQHKIVNIVVRHTKRHDVRYAIKHIEDSKPLLYCPNWDRVKNSEVVYVPFGIIDSWSFEAIGLASVTGITGKSLSPELLQTLGKQIILVPDEGEEREAHQIANKLGWRASVKILKYDDGCKDPDSVRITMGNEYLLQAVS